MTGNRCLREARDRGVRIDGARCVNSKDIEAECTIRALLPLDRITISTQSMDTLVNMRRKGLLPNADCYRIVSSFLGNDIFLVEGGGIGQRSVSATLSG